MLLDQSNLVGRSNLFNFSNLPTHANRKVSTQAPNTQKISAFMIYSDAVPSLPQPRKYLLVPFPSSPPILDTLEIRTNLYLTHPIHLSLSLFSSRVNKCLSTIRYSETNPPRYSIEEATRTNSFIQIKINRISLSLSFY